MRASVIIPTFNRVDDLLALLDSIRRTRLLDYEVIAVDDGSTDSTAERCRERPDVRLLRLERSGGPSRARNLGAASAHGETLIFVDSDVLLLEDRDVLAEMVEALERRPEVDYVLTASHVVPRSESVVAYSYSVYHAYYMGLILAGRVEVEGRVMFFTTRLGAIRRARFQASGGFYESLWTVMNEDGEFGTRCYHLGYRAYFRRDFLHLHRFATRLAALVPNYFRTAMVQAQIDADRDTSADPSVGGGEKARRILALGVLLATPALTMPMLAGSRFACAALWAALLAGLWPLHGLVMRHVPPRLWPGWYVVYVAVTPAIFAGYAYGLVGHWLGGSLLRGRPSSLPYFATESSQ